MRGRECGYFSSIVKRLDFLRAEGQAELARLLQFVVIPRPGETDVPFPAPFRGRMLRGFPLGVSSSQIRERLKAGSLIDHLVPAAVAEAIRNNRLYL